MIFSSLSNFFVKPVPLYYLWTLYFPSLLADVLAVPADVLAVPVDVLGVPVLFLMVTGGG